VSRDLAAYDDVRPTFERLADAGGGPVHRLERRPAIVEWLLESAGVDDLVSTVVSADEFRTFKPAPELYRHAVERLGTPAGRAVLVSGFIFDVQGARNAGMQGVWLDRDDGPRDPSVDPPDCRVSSLSELPSELDIE
jgi:2-haloacid dehalogenase